MKLEFPHFDQGSVLVAGDIMLDRYWYGGTSRISPEAPVPVVKVNHAEERVGGAGNVALNISALGCAASLVSIVGHDHDGETLLQKLESAGIRCGFEVSSGKPTITKHRVLSRNQQLLRMDFEETFERQEVAGVNSRVVSMLAGSRVLVLSDYAKGALVDPSVLIAAAKEKGIPVLVDPKGADFERYRGATLLTPNLHELETVVGSCKGEANLAAKGEELIKELGLEAMLVTRGEQGMTLLRPNVSPLHLPARAREVFDVTGAGDTVIATLAASMAAGIPLPESVALANIAAGIVVAKVGTATVSGPELRRAIMKEQGSERGVLNAEQLALDLADARAQGETIVFTNGCFDILHAGHVGYLEEARKLGSRLVVAINGDASVKRLKGDGRPINPVERRMAVLAGLEVVDWVTWFEEDTPEELLKVLRPDVLVKGGDYGPAEVVGKDIVEAYGGTVAVLGFLDDCSTTAIVKKVLAQGAKQKK